MSLASYNKRKNEHMNMKTSVITCFQKFITIKGRASRSEFWWFYLFILIMASFMFFLDSRLLRSYTYSQAPLSLHELWGILISPALICVSVRRLHDIDRTGKWFLSWFASIAIMAIGGTFLNLIMDDGLKLSVAYLSLFSVLLIIGTVSHFGHMIIILVFNCLKGTDGDNRFGADPLAK